uniref:Lipoprotein n=1 Tax=mine drainage metagenome TaxID=410659 RepID=E6PHE6_9ZZZZ
MKLKQYRYILAIAAAGVLLSGCGGSGGNGSKGLPPISSVNPVQTGTLEFAVGTANVYGTKAGLNVVSTYRQADGLSNVLIDTPTITGPFTVPAFSAAGSNLEGYGVLSDPYSTLPGGPSITEVATPGTITGTSQTLPAGTPACDQTTPCTFPNNATGGTGTVQPNTSTFGQAGGVFVNGISPGNSTTSGVAASYVPYEEPMYDTTGSTFEPWGGPPAFDPNKDNMGVRDGLTSLGAFVLGIPEGFSVFENVSTAAGAYQLSLAVPTGFNGQTPTSATVTATAKLASTALLPTLSAPALTLDQKGGGTFTLPAADFSGGITEVYVQIEDTGNGKAQNCQGPAGADSSVPEPNLGLTVALPVYYTVVAKAAGNYTLPDTDGPNTNTTGGPTGLTPSESICTGAANTTANGGTVTPGDSYSVQIIGTDYDMYGATYPITTSASPTLTGANGQADITISAPSAVQVSP